MWLWGYLNDCISSIGLSRIIGMLTTQGVLLIPRVHRRFCYALSYHDTAYSLVRIVTWGGKGVISGLRKVPNVCACLSQWHWNLFGLGCICSSPFCAKTTCWQILKWFVRNLFSAMAIAEWWAQLSHSSTGKKLNPARFDQICSQLRQANKI